MKILVVFYSRTGNTRRVGEEIAKNLNADIDEIIDKKKRNGIIGWLGCGRDALFKKLTEIENKKRPEEYDVAIIGTPVWAGTISSAIRTYLLQNKFNKTAFFCTCGGDKGKTFNEMEKLSTKPQAVLELKYKEINECKGKIKSFCQTFR
jgi:flavodoxin